MNIRILGLAAAAVTAAPLMGSFPQQAEAATCRILTYFAEPAKETVVGTWSNCPGIKGGSGQRTAYYIATDAPELVGGHSPSAGQPPCEFLAAGCGHLPRSRH